MFVFTGQGTEIVNSDYVTRFMLVQKDDATLITAVLSSESVVTIGRYTEKEEAEAAMTELMDSLADGASHFMRGNTGRYLPEKKQNGYHGRKSIGHGGS